MLAPASAPVIDHVSASPSPWSASLAAAVNASSAFSGVDLLPIAVIDGGRFVFATVIVKERDADRLPSLAVSVTPAYTPPFVSAASKPGVHDSTPVVAF